MIRKTLIATFLFLLLIVVFLMNGWNLFNLNDWLQQRLVGELRHRLGENCTIEKTTFGFGSVNLIGVNLELKDAPYHLWIDELRLGYSLESLWKGRARPTKSADEISIHHPRLTLIQGKKIEDEEKNIDLSLQLTEEAEESYRSFIREYDFIERITIADGELLALDGDSAITTVATNINGWAYTDKTDHAWVRVAGHIFESDEFNMVMYGQLDLRRGGIDYLNAELHNYRIGNEIPFLLPDYLEVTDGIVNGKFTITERLQPSRGFNIQGDFKLDSGSLRLASENLFFDDIDIEGSLRNWNLVIKEASQTVNGSKTRVTGNIHNILAPEFELELTSDEVAVHDFLARFLPEKQFPFEGNARLDFKISDSVEHPRVEGVVAADSLLVYGKSLKDLHVDVRFANMNLQFRDIAASFEEADLSGSGNIDFSPPGKLMNFKIDVDGEFTEALRDLGISSADQCIGTTRTQIFGPLEQPVSTSEFDVKFIKQETKSLALNGSLRYSRGRVEITSQNNLNNFQLQASIDSVFSKRTYLVDVRHLENVLDFLDQPRFDFIKNRYSINLTGGGTEDSLRLGFEGFLKNDYRKVFQIQSLNDAVNRRIKGRIQLLPNSEKATEGSFQFDRVQEHRWRGSCEIGSWLRGGLSYTSEGQDSLGGTLTISGLELPLFLELVGKKTDDYSGNIFGQLKLTSQQEEPTFDGQLWLMDAAIGQIAPLEGEFVFRADNREMTINKLFLKNSESSSLNAAGKVSFDDRLIDMSVTGERIDLNDIITTVTGRDSVIQGTASMDIRLNGKFGEMPLSGTIIIDKPHILMFDFAEAVFDFGSIGTSNGSYVSGDALSAENVTLKTDGFSVDGKAFLPFESTHDLDVSLSGDGNFLSLLEDLTDLFKGSESVGHLDLKMGGFYTTPYFAGSEARFHEGVLYLSSVTKRVENLTGELSVRDADYFLDIRKLEGTIGDHELWIENTNTLGGLNHGIYEPLRIAGDDLNMGALILHTEEGGIPINVPGLMEQREIGWYDFKGKTPAESFFIAGPWDRPKVRGRVRVRNANLTFPFDESVGEGNPIVLNIINNIDWDVDAISSNDTRYVREFQTGVYVNMEVDKENSWLDFQGIMKDSTFVINGKVETTRGDLEYLDLNFRVEKIGAEWSNSLYPNVYGKAWTVVRDSTNIPTDVYLTLFTVDDLTKSEVSKGRWDRINVKLSSEYPGYDETQSDLMATLGYSSETLDDKAKQAVGYSTDRFLFRPLIRPIERELENRFRLDVVRFSYAIARNFLNSSFNNEELNSSLALLRSSRLMLGKYLTDDIYFLYTGELKTALDYQYLNKNVGLQHIVGLEYRLNPRLLLQVEYDYNTLFETHRGDKKLRLRHSFPF